jgi:ATP-dependent exoDNAse (exonuclease V) beta subunit
VLDAIRRWHGAFREAKYATLLDLFYVILNETDAIAAADMLPDLGHFSRFLAEAETQIRNRELEKRLGWFLSYANAASGAFDGPTPLPQEAVQIMTIHKSKGLEFPVVVIADTVEGTIPAEFPEDVRTQLRRHLAGVEPWLDTVEEASTLACCMSSRRSRHRRREIARRAPSGVPVRVVPDTPHPFT